MVETFASAEVMRANGRRLENVSVARTTEVLRDPKGRVIPKGARVTIKYAGSQKFDIVWGDKRDNRLPLAVRGVGLDSLDFLASR